MLKPFIMQIKREWWENQTIIFKMPFISSILIIVGLIIGISYTLYDKNFFTVKEGGTLSLSMAESNHHRTKDILNNTTWIFSSAEKEKIEDMKLVDETFISKNNDIYTKDSQLNISSNKYQNNILFMLSRDKGFNITIQAFFLAITLVYLASGMSRDRKDNSIFFWRSLPVSETRNVLTKLLVGIIGIPLSYFTILFFTSFIIASILGLYKWLFIPSHLSEDIHIFTSFVSTSYDILLSMINIWFMMFLALPIIGCVMAFSAYFNRFALIIMSIPILIITIVETVIFDRSYIMSTIKNYLASAAQTLHIVRTEFIFPTDVQQYMIAMALGAALIAISIGIRRWQID